MTVAMRGGELVVDAAVAKLKAGLSSRISAINSEKADGIIVSIPNGEDYYVGGVTLLARAPRSSSPSAKPSTPAKAPTR
jgi:hypothetical protein